MEVGSLTLGGATVLKLNKSNYPIWKTRMADLLCVNDLLDPIELEGVKPATTTDSDWIKLNRKVVAMIRQCVDHDTFCRVAQETDAYKLWKTLEGVYEKRDLKHKLFMIRKLKDMRLRNGQSATEYIGEFQQLLNELSSMEVVLGDEVEGLLLLNSLCDSWEDLVVPVSVSAPDGKVTLSVVKERILNEEDRRKLMGLY